MRHKNKTNNRIDIGSITSGNKTANLSLTNDTTYNRVASSNGGKHPALTREDTDRYRGGAPSLMRRKREENVLRILEVLP